MNNIFDGSNPLNFQFICSVLAVLCRERPLTVSLKDIEIYWNGEIERLQYDIISDGNGSGVITFSLKEK